MADEEASAAETPGEQLARIEGSLRQLDATVRTQGVQARASDLAVLQELQKLVSGGAQRAMAGIFNKLFRDLLKHMNDLDELVAAARRSGSGDGRDEAWWNALTVSRDRFEGILRDWGCTPLEVRVGEEEFDPELHEPAAAPERGTNTIREVRRRGWRSGADVLQLPLVVVD